MPIMDLKHKGIAWAGSFYQKLESVCQEVDGFVSKDTVKYVENQLQNMGGSVKKFCSDVVQDVLPPLVEPVRREAEAVALKSNAASSSYLKSMISDEENQLDTIIKQLHVEPNAVSLAKNELPDASCRLQIVNHIKPISIDSLEEAENESSVENIDNDLTNENPKRGPEENVMEDLALEGLEAISSGDKESFEASLSGEFKDDNNENALAVLADVSLASSYYGVEFQYPPEKGAVCDSLADATQSVSDVSTTFTSSESSFSVLSVEKTLAEMRPTSSTSCLLAESCTLSGESLGNNVKAVSSNNPGDHICDSRSKLSSSASTATVSFRNKELELGLPSSCSILSSRSLEENTSRIKEMLSLIESSGNRHIQFYESAQGHSCDLDNDITDPCLETVELCDKVKLDESCVIVEPSELYAVARRARKLRSFRKKIQDAFTSKKRLAEEYEQLAIWYGDADMEPGKDECQPSLPCTPATPLDLRNSQIQPPLDSEWELL